MHFFLGAKIYLPLIQLSTDLAMGLAETEGSNRPGADLSGSWRDEVPKLKTGLAKLEKDRADFQFDYRKLIGKYVFDKVFLSEGYTLHPLAKNFSLEMPDGFYELQFDVEARPAEVRTWGPMWIEANGSDRTDTFTVSPSATAQRSLITEVRQNRMHMMIASESTGVATLSRMTMLRVEPRIAHVPMRRFVPGKDVTLKTTVAGENGIRSVQVFWRDVSGRYSIREMNKFGLLTYELAIPTAECHADGNYFIVATDNKGRISTYPENGRAKPIAIKPLRTGQLLSVTHEPIRSARPNEPLRITAIAKASAGIRHVLVRYRGVTQFQDYYALDMLPTGRPGEYMAEIPAMHIVSQFDFMYFFEIFDNDDNGRIFPDEAKETPYIVVKLDRLG
jgi:hypothetical protein